MSRIGKQPVSIPSGVEVSVSANIVTVKGAKGTLSFTHTTDVKVSVVESQVVVEKLGESKRAQAIWGTTAKILSNMIEGVSKGFEKKLELNGVGYRMSVSGRTIDLALGFSHPVKRTVPEGLEAKVEKNTLSISGSDKQAVGQFAAEIRALKPVEPYKGKGFRYDDEQVRRKEGKKAAA
jgi:large subunit ribosomal protein L6